MTLSLFLMAAIGLTSTVLAATPVATAEQQAEMSAEGSQLARLQALEAELAAAQAKLDGGAKCPADCRPAPKPVRTSVPKPTVTPVVSVAPASVPDPRIAEQEALIVVLEAEIATLKAAIDRPIVVNVAAPVVNVEAPKVTVAPVVHTEHTTVVRTSGTRAQFGVGESVMMAPPLPGSTLSTMDRTEIFGRYQWALGSRTWLALEVDAGYGFAADSTSIRALPELVINVGNATDIVLGAGPSVLCEGALTGPELCSSIRTGGQGQVGIAQQIGPIGGELFVGGGYDMVDSVTAGSGNVGYGYAGIRLFVGKVGSGTYLQ